MSMGSAARKDSRVPVPQRPTFLTGPRLYGAQFGALLHKNLKLRAAAWKTNMLLLAQAALFMLLIWGVDQALVASRQRQAAYSSQLGLEPFAVGPIPDCSSNIYLRKDRACYTIAYAPAGDPVVEAIITGVAENNQPPLPPEHLKGFTSDSEIDEYLLQNPETVLSAVVISVHSDDDISFTVQTNSSVQWFKGAWQHPNTYIQLPIQAAVERELTRRLLDQPDLDWAPSLSYFPHPATKTPSMIGSIAPTFILASIMFQFVLQLHDVVQDRESGARQAMATMGMRTGAYWASWFVYQAGLAILEGLLLVGFGYLFQFSWLTANNVWLSMLLLTMVPLAMASFGFFLSTFMKTAASSVPLGFTIFVVAWVFLIVIAFGYPYSSKYATGGVVLFSLFPWSLLSKGIADLGAAAESGFGLGWTDRVRYCMASGTAPPPEGGLYTQSDCVMPLGYMYGVLAMQCIGYAILALYLDAVLPDANGVRRAPWFFLQPGYWMAQYRPDRSHAARALNASTQEATGLVVDPDVAAEMERVKLSCQRFLGEQSEVSVTPEEIAAQQLSGLQTEDDDEHTVKPTWAIEMYGLRKEFGSSPGCFSQRHPFVAVRGTWLGVKEGECFALLGPNGAGKSTTIHCLTGVLPLTKGDALVHGISLASPGGMDCARPLLGVCPQFDVLWDQLTGKDHLLLFAAIKGIPRGDRERASATLLEEVRLTEAAKQRTGTYSGGMRRRLSVALALLGDPKVVFLDEPTTGLDPISRRHLWDLIDRAKRDRAIVLTTHSMEEADILGDRIGIMARGRLRCVGTALRLKNRFGSGYRISVRVSSADTEAAVSSSTPDAFRIKAIVGVLRASNADATPNETEEGAENATSVQARAAQIKTLFRERLGVEPADESTDYVHFMCPYENEDKLPSLFHYLKSHKQELGVIDLQVRQTPLEDVFLVVTRKAELEYAQAEGKFEMLNLVEEGITVKVPIGAEFIKSPSGRLYHIRWVSDADCRLQLLDYQPDPISKLLDATNPTSEKESEESEELPLSVGCTPRQQQQ